MFIGQFFCFFSNLVWWHHEVLQFDTSLNDLDPHSGWQGYKKAKTYAIILLLYNMEEPNFYDGWLCYWKDCKEI